jgi:glycosyltransferase involved in cell wall biosynthesis
VDYWKTLSMDIGLGPLRDTPFNRAKSDLRAREYMALGIVPVLPYLRPYYQSFVDGVEGRFVYPHQTLSGVLNQVARDPEWMASASAAGREVAAREFTTETNLGRIVEAWTSA